MTHVEPVGFATDDKGHIIVKVHQVVRDPQGNVITEGMVEHVYLIEDGLIKSMEIKKPWASFLIRRLRQVSIRALAIRLTDRVSH